MSNSEVSRESLKDTIFEDIEPYYWDFEKDGLWLPKQKPKTPKGNAIKSHLKCIDKALKRVYGKDWNKPLK